MQNKIPSEKDWFHRKKRFLQRQFAAFCQQNQGFAQICDFATMILPATLQHQMKTKTPKSPEDYLQ